MPPTPYKPLLIPWHRRMEARVAVGVSLLVALSLGAVLLAATRVVTSNSLRRSSEDLQAARAAFDQLVRNRAEFAAAQTRLITALPIFRAHLTDARLAADAATIQTMAEEYRSQLKAQFCVVTDARGGWMGSPGWPAGEDAPAAVRAGIGAALAGRSNSDIVERDGQLFLLVSEPARFAEEVLGTLTAGYALDDAVAEELAQVTHSDVNLVSGDRLSGSSLDPPERAGLAALITAGSLPTQVGVSADIRKLGNSEYVYGTFPIFADQQGQDRGRLVLLQDWKPTQQFLDELQRQLLGVGVLTFALALAAGLVFSRRMSRPVRDIAEAAGEIAAGNWKRHVPIRGSAEATSMAVAFNDMTTNLRHWYEEAKASAEHLQASYQRFYSVTQSASDAIISTNGSGAIIFWSRSAGTIFGYTEEEALGEPLTRLVAGPDRETCLRKLEELRSAGTDATPGRTMEMRGVRKDETEFPVEFSLAAWKDGDATFFTAVVRDVTERKQADEALRQREEQLRQAQKMEAVGQLAGGIAHDFNNLLTVIHGYSEFLLQGMDPADERREDAQEILKAAERAAGLTRQLLAFSRKQILSPQVFALEEIVTNTEKMLRRLIGEDIDLTAVTEGGGGFVRADPGQIEQILMNLAVNARDAMPKGGKLHIALKDVELADPDVPAQNGLQPGPYVRLTVSDTGSGMDAETLSRVFEPFFTTKAFGKGTGLGLATVYGIVRQSGGAIDVDSEPGRGTTFRIYFPRVEQEERAAAPPLQQDAGGRSETVLLVEDDPQVRGLVGSILRKTGYTVLEASQADEALDIAGRHAGVIDLLLTDVVMPGMSGRELSELLSASRTDMTVLFMSGYTDDAILSHGVERASTRFIQKPFSADALTEKIREALQHAHEAV